jgi:hypothetical protein
MIVDVVGSAFALPAAAISRIAHTHVGKAVRILLLLLMVPVWDRCMAPLSPPSASR